MRSTYARIMAQRRVQAAYRAERERPGTDLAERLERLGAQVGDYPPEWPTVAMLVKALAGWKCERCGRPHGPIPGVLTVHHLDGDKWNLNDWNLAALCQRCHLRVQGRVIFMQDWPFEHSPWMARHVLGYNEWAGPRGLPPLSMVGIVERSYADEWPK